MAKSVDFSKGIRGKYVNRLKYSNPMSGETLAVGRKSIGLRPKTMAKMLMVSFEEYKRWEEEGLRVPHDVEGPTTRVIELILSKKVSKSLKTDLLKTFNYPGPEQTYKDVKLILPMSDLVKAGEK
jgi:DNA-binding transcriptional regulator YiaG